MTTADKRKLALFCLLTIAFLAIKILSPAKPVTTQKPFSPLLDDAAFLAVLDHSPKNGRKGIALVAPGSGLHGDDVERLRELAQKAGLALPDEAVDPGVVPYTANSDAKRLRLLEAALNDPDVGTLWAIRGGYGSGRLLPALDTLRLPERQKLFVGYSDMTFLHLFLLKKNWRTVHGSMFWELGNPDADEDNFRLLARVLSGETRELSYDGIAPFNAAAKTIARPIEASVTGGNLTCLAAAAGTPWQPDTAGKILLLEDVKEKGYKLDRMLTQLEQAGYFDRVAAVLLGTFTKGDDHTEFALERFAADCGKPVFRTDLFGHGRKNRPLVFGAPATLAKAPDGDAFTLRIRLDDPAAAE